MASAGPRRVADAPESAIGNGAVTGALHPETASYDRAAMSRRVLLGSLLVVCTGFAAFALAHMFPPAPYGLADDWRVFYAAAQVIAHGGNPYDAATIHAAEQTAQHYASVQPSLDDFADLPIVGLFLRAFSWLPYWWSYAVFTALGMVVAGASLRLWMRELGWPSAGLWVLGALCSWPLLVGALSGQFDLLLLGATVTALLLMRRDRPWLSGLCMAAVLLKPHILWPLPLLLATSWVGDMPQLRRFALSAGGVLVAGTVAGFLLVPHSGSFFAHLLNFESTVTAVQPDLAGIPGLVAHLPHGALLGDGIAVVGVAGVLALAVASIRQPALRALPADRRHLIPLVGLAFWLACTPYAHPNDDVLLFPLLIAVVGEAGRRLDPRWLEVGMIMSLALIGCFVGAPVVGAVLVVLSFVGWAWWWRRIPGPAAASVALAAVVLLPDIWPFHVVPVSLTPIAVTLVFVAGGLELRGLLGVPTAAAPLPAAAPAGVPSS